MQLFGRNRMLNASKVPLENLVSVASAGEINHDSDGKAPKKCSVTVFRSIGGSYDNDAQMTLACRGGTCWIARGRRIVSLLIPRHVLVHSRDSTMLMRHSGQDFVFPLVIIDAIQLEEELGKDASRTWIHR